MNVFTKYEMASSQMLNKAKSSLSLESLLIWIKEKYYYENWRCEMEKVKKLILACHLCWGDRRNKFLIFSYLDCGRRHTDGMKNFYLGQKRKC